jgi:hypothetical protein
MEQKLEEKVTRELSRYMGDGPGFRHMSTKYPAQQAGGGPRLLEGEPTTAYVLGL